MQLASYYRQIGDKLIVDLVRGLQAGTHYALLGPRRGSKAWIVEALVLRANTLAAGDRPHVVKLQWQAHHEASHTGFLKYLADSLGLDAPETAPDARLSGQVAALIVDALGMDKRPIWLLIQDVLGFPKSIARELLAALNSLHEQLSDTDEGRRLGAVVTGSADFTPLTTGPNSPYRHAKLILVSGLDYEHARHFFLERRARLLGDPAKAAVSEEVFGCLYEATNGNANLLQELVIAPARHPYYLAPDGSADVYGSRLAAEGMIEHFILNFMRDDQYSIEMVREAERDAESFDLLLRVLEGPGRLTLPGRPHALEVCGLLVKQTKSVVTFSCPMIENFVRRTVTPRHIADVYVSQRRWDKAVPAYEFMASFHASLKDRPVSGHAQYHLRESILVWKDQMMDEAQWGIAPVVRHFLDGMHHLFSFDRGGLYARNGSGWVESATFGCEQMAPPPPQEESESGPGLTKSISGDQLSMMRLIASSGSLPEWPVCSLFLQRDHAGHEIDSAERAILDNSVDRFCHAYKAAEEIEYRRRIGELREQHLKVIERVNEAVLNKQFDLGHVVRCATDALVDVAGYRRVQICLVNARRNRIQSVASCHKPGILDFRDPTNYPLRVPRADVQAWVVANKQIAIIDEAAEWYGKEFDINVSQSVALGMKAFTVVPMITGDVVIGTIHIEREDREPPVQIEQELYLLLAGHIAGVCRQAQRLEMLQNVVEASDDEIRIADPTFRLVYLNRAAHDREPHSPTAGWQDKNVRYDWRRHAWASNGPQRGEALEKARLGETARYFLTSDAPTAPQAQALDISGIVDFRGGLTSPLVADGLIGFVEHIRDMTPLYEIVAEITEWLKVDNLKEAAQTIVETAVRRDYDWCRIYLYHDHPREGRYLESFAESGLQVPENIDAFRSGGIREYPDSDPLPHGWHVILEAKGPTIYEIPRNRAPKRKQIVRAPNLEGAPRFYTTARDCQRKLENDNIRRWIEAPLLVGDRVVGVMTLPMPRAPLTPSKWVLLGLFVQCAALTLDSVIRAEERATPDRQTAAAMIWIFHQFRQPLFACRGWLRLLGPTDQDPSQNETISAIKEAITRMERISADYLHWIREYVPIITGGDIVDAMKQTCKRAGVYRENVLPEVVSDINAYFVYTDLTEIQRAVDELIWNAIRAGATNITVRLNTKSNSNEVTLLVEDNGPGIPQEKRQRLFEPAPSKSSGGTGFGLATVRKHLGLLEGLIDFEERSEGGACFRLRIPLSPAEPIGHRKENSYEQ